MKNEINPVKGLIVKIKKFRDSSTPFHWSPSMSVYCGSIQTISHIDDFSKQTYLYGIGYYWYKEDFLKVNTNE